MYTNYITFNHKKKINKECYADSKIIFISINSFFECTTIEEIKAEHFMSLYGHIHNTESVNIEEYMTEHKVAVVYSIEHPKNKISTFTFVNSDGNSKTIHLI